MKPTTMNCVAEYYAVNPAEASKSEVVFTEALSRLLKSRERLVDQLSATDKLIEWHQANLRRANQA